MIRMLTMAQVFALFLLTAQGVFLDGHAHAKHRLTHCCACDMCNSNCYCSGESPYCTCAAPDDGTLQFNAHTDKSPLDIRGIREPRAFFVANSNMTGRLETLMAGKRARGIFALKMLDKFANGLKIWCPSSVEQFQLGNAVASQMLKHTEK